MIATHSDLEQLASGWWYYSIELKSGLVTKGRDDPGVALVREALRRIRIAGRQCIDIGVQEALIPVLLCRHGAASVEAQDRFPMTRKVNAVKQAYGVDFTYVEGGSIVDFSSGREARNAGPADIVIFAGVLYHMFDPLAGLCRVRALAGLGGIVMLETAAVVISDTDFPVTYFNARNSLYPSSTYFLPNATWLDAALRFVGLEPLDCLFLRHGNRKDIRLGRICVPCRAVLPQDIADPQKRAWERDYIARDFSEFIDLSRLSLPVTPVSYDQSRSTAIRQTDGSIDIASTVQKGVPTPVTKQDTTLMLADWN